MLLVAVDVCVDASLCVKVDVTVVDTLLVADDVWDDVAELVTLLLTVDVALDVTEVDAVLVSDEV